MPLHASWHPPKYVIIRCTAVLHPAKALKFGQVQRLSRGASCPHIVMWCQPAHKIDLLHTCRFFGCIIRAMQPPGWQLVGIMVLCAEFLLILSRSKNLQTIAKAEQQRTAPEHKQVEQGLARCLLLEALVFVPASVLLVFITIRPLLLLSEAIRIRAVSEPSLAFAFYGCLGLSSYGFPFATVRTVVSRAALITLKEFAAIAHSPIAPDSDTPQGQGTVSGGD
jgi:hypothetical protein